MSGTIVEVDRTSHLVYPPRTSVVLHAEFRLLRPPRYLLDGLESWALKNQTWPARAIYEYLKHKRLLQRSFGLDDLLAIQKIPPDVLPEHLQGKCLPAYAGMIEGGNGKELPILLLSLQRHILWVSPENIFDGDFPTLLFKGE